MGAKRGAAADVGRVLAAAKARLAVHLHGVHGVAHWTRVRENGHRLARDAGADKEVVELFAFLHDCCREGDGYDPGHGERAAEFAATLRGSFILLPDDRFDRLYEAVRDHEKGFTRSDVTVMTCWDADRLDLGRVGITPHPKYLGTEVAKRPATIQWADGRASFGVVPKIVWDEWRI
ncbi:MAG TPA: HD domain-containing protein, partial [Urbifossiella sp.]|nr:HD domain-containing protein [Urbifossiella sp.]